jgi:hypothetical protein
VFFAPYTGKKTRDKIKKGLEELDLDDVISRFSEAFEEGKKEAEKAAQEFRD